MKSNHVFIPNNMDFKLAYSFRRGRNSGSRGLRAAERQLERQLRRGERHAGEVRRPDERVLDGRAVHRPQQAVARVDQHQRPGDRRRVPAPHDLCANQTSE